MKCYKFSFLLLIVLSLNAMDEPDAIPLLRQYKNKKVPQISLIDKQRELKKVIILEQTPLEGAINYFRWFPFETKEFVQGKRAALILTYCGASTLCFSGFFLSGCLKASSMVAASLICGPYAIPCCLCGAFLADEACLCCGKSIASSCNSKANVPAKSISIPKSNLENLLWFYKERVPVKEQNAQLIRLLSQKDEAYYTQPLYFAGLPAEMAQKISKLTVDIEEKEDTRVVNSKAVYYVIQALYKNSPHKRTFRDGLTLKDGYNLQVKDELLEAWLYHLKPAGSTVYLPGTSFSQKY